MQAMQGFPSRGSCQRELTDEVEKYIIITTPAVEIWNYTSSTASGLTDPYPSVSFTDISPSLKGSRPLPLEGEGLILNNGLTAISFLYYHFPGFVLPAGLHYFR